MKKIIFLFLILPLVFFCACDEDDIQSDRFYIETHDITIQATEYNKWHYFSFETGEEVGTGDASADSDAAWAVRSDWDIAFSTLYIRMNCNTSGAGSAGSLEITGDDKEMVFNSIVLAPTTLTYTTDIVSNTPLVIGIDPERTYTASYNDLASGWITFNRMVGTDGDYVSTRKTFVMKTAKGNYVKVLLKSFLEGHDGLEPVIYIKDPETGEDTSYREPSTARKGVITFSYALQTDGSESLMTRKP